ncbi:hypothetical protein ACFOPN_22535 [Xanthomonas hyacinthi]
MQSPVHGSVEQNAVAVTRSLSVTENRRKHGDGYAWLPDPAVLGADCSRA